MTTLLDQGIGGWEMLILFSIVLLPVLLWLLALISCLKSEFKDTTNKLIWVLLIIFLPVLGAILYFVIGRNQRV